MSENIPVSPVSPASPRRLRKERIGRVLSNAMEKSIVVEVLRRVKHPVYKKIIGRRSRLVAHDAENVCNVGDTVQIMETRPLSKSKNWRLVKVLEKVK